MESQHVGGNSSLDDKPNVRVGKYGVFLFFPSSRFSIQAKQLKADVKGDITGSQHTDQGEQLKG